MATRGLGTSVRSIVLAGICALQIQCGGSDCQTCSAATSCPAFTKQCPGFTATVQQCGGAAGGKQCCAKSAAEIPCQAFREVAGSYNVTEGIVSFSSSDQQCLHYWIDAGENGWVSKGMTRSEAEAGIRSKMAEVSPNGTPY